MRFSRAALAGTMVCASLWVLAALTASTTGAQGPESGGMELSGRRVHCDNVDVIMDRRLPSEGAAAPGVLMLNPRMLNEQPPIVRLFVFHHECGHHHIGASELKADCWAVTEGVKQGWLDRVGLAEACRSFGDAPPTPTHPSGAKRCANLDRCFAAATTVQARLLQARQQSTTPALMTASITREAPRLVSGPILVRSGILR
jgi:hypothetical protein